MKMYDNLNIRPVVIDKPLRYGVACDVIHIDKIVELRCEYPTNSLPPCPWWRNSGEFLGREWWNSGRKCCYPICSPSGSIKEILVKVQGASLWRMSERILANPLGAPFIRNHPDINSAQMFDLGSNSFVPPPEMYINVSSRAVPTSFSKIEPGTSRITVTGLISHHEHLASPLQSYFSGVKTLC